MPASGFDFHSTRGELAFYTYGCSTIRVAYERVVPNDFYIPVDDKVSFVIDPLGNLNSQNNQEVTAAQKEAARKFSEQFKKRIISMLTDYDLKGFLAFQKEIGAGDDRRIVYTITKPIGKTMEELEKIQLKSFLIRFKKSFTWLLPDIYQKANIPPGAAGSKSPLSIIMAQSFTDGAVISPAQLAEAKELRVPPTLRTAIFPKTQNILSLYMKLANCLQKYIGEEPSVFTTEPIWGELCTEIENIREFGKGQTFLDFFVAAVGQYLKIKNKQVEEDQVQEITTQLHQIGKQFLPGTEIPSR